MYAGADFLSGSVGIEPQQAPKGAPEVYQSDRDRLTLIERKSAGQPAADSWYEQASTALDHASRIDDIKANGWLGSPSRSCGPARRICGFQPTRCGLSGADF
jgi:hypothetical protein